MLHLYLIRHGQSEVNLLSDQIIVGRTNNSPLSAVGKEQCRLLSAILKGHFFSRVYCSPAARTLQVILFALCLYVANWLAD
jgi:broad specificity phosphatase PhoE